MYAAVVWYKLVFLGGAPVPPEWRTLDQVCRAVAATSTFWNEISGIMLLPKVNTQTPLILRQIFAVGTSMGLATFMLLAIIQLRAWFPEGNAIIGVVSIVAVAWNILAVSMGLRAAIILSNEELLTVEELEEKQLLKKKKKPPSNVSSFFYDVFIRPDKFDGTMHTKEGLQFIAYGSKIVAQVVTMSTSSIPGLVMGIIAINLATNSAMPNLGPGQLYSEHGISFTLSVLEMMAFSVIPANLLDLTLVLRKRMIPHRAALEVPISFLSSMFGPIFLALAILPDKDAWEWMAMLRAMVWPIMGRIHR